MTLYNTAVLPNGIRIITKKNANTPRISLNIFMLSGSKPDTNAGTGNLAGRLLLQGTTTKTAEDIANEIDSKAIEVSVEAKQDYLRIKTLFLNEDFQDVLEILEDLLKNSTFENYKKEAQKFKGELTLDLDSPKVLAFDNLLNTIYPNHPYGNGHTKVLEAINSITIDNLRDFYFKNSLNAEKIIISIVGDIETETALSALSSKFADIKTYSENKTSLKTDEISENKTITIAKNDSAQAQIIQGWLAPSITEEDYPTMVLLNTILGASGLSSRLFVELRDKKGLAYTVRSSYEALLESGLFSLYIGTNPKNIKTCLEGFEEEINKLKTILVEEKELYDAKNNFFGKRAFFHETNAHQAFYLGLYEAMGLSPKFDDEIAEKVKNVTSQQIMDAANKYFSKNSVISILAPQEYL